MLREVRRSCQEAAASPLPVADLAASFQAAVVDVLVGKTLQAAQKLRRSRDPGGRRRFGQRALREAFQAQSHCPVHIPPLALCTDNAAMIAAPGYYRFIQGQRDALDMDVLPNWPVNEL